jgi:hypothetical protein
MSTKKGKVKSNRLSRRPVYEKLPWPGLRAKDHLSRVVTRSVKEAREERERYLWAEKQIARMLQHISPWTAMRLFFLGMKRRGRKVPRSLKDVLKHISD